MIVVPEYFNSNDLILKLILLFILPDTPMKICGSVISSNTCIRLFNSNDHSFIKSFTCLTAILSNWSRAIHKTAGTMSGSSRSRWQTHDLIILTPEKYKWIYLNFLKKKVQASLINKLGWIQPKISIKKTELGEEKLQATI